LFWIEASPLSCEGFEVTVTLTIAGVTRAATVSMAWSSASNALTLLSSSAAAAGAGVGADALAGFANSYVANETVAPIATTGTNMRRAAFVLNSSNHFMCSSLLVLCN
jgi:hypothetical protein